MELSLPRTTKVVDSHTAGEPTRIVIEGGPDLGMSPLPERLARLRRQFDFFRCGVINEPRGSDVLVGGLLCKPFDSSCTAAIIFFNNEGYLGMCGHGLIGLVVTLHYLKRIEPGVHRIETPVGIVQAELKESGEVSFQNVPSYRWMANVELEVPGYGLVVGDVAWGGNWFFLTDASPGLVASGNIAELSAYAQCIRCELKRRGIRGADDAAIDHVELFAPSQDPNNSSRNFVLCPGGAYDRSPCGTGTSAKLACLAAEGKLKTGEVWKQESIIGTVFTATYTDFAPNNLQTECDGNPIIIPVITGSAYVCAESTLVFDPLDPFVHGIRR